MEKQSRSLLFRRYLSFLKPYRIRLGFIVALGLLQFVVPLTVPWMTKVMIDEVLPGKESFWTLQKVVGVLAGVYLAGNLLKFVHQVAISRLGSRMIVDVREQLYRHMQSLSQNYFESRQVGSIVSRVLNDVNGAQNLVGGGVLNLLVDLFLVGFAAIMLFRLDPGLALLSLCLLPLYYLTFTNLNVRIRFAWRSVHQQMERISGILVERLAGMKIVQAFNRESIEADRFHRQAKHHYRYTVKAQLLSNLLGRASQSFQDLGGILVWLAGGTMVLNGAMTLGELIAFQAYLSQLYGPIQRFSEVNVTIQNSLSNVERIFEVFDLQPEVKNRENPLPLPACRGDVVFENVSFTYVSERPVPKPKGQGITRL
ncbi:ABC transporter ATP-binding protein [Paenibacillus sp. CC-CFT747]|nr:ABC transporter ATP-binding protein [Paenibacillus sp. CC-CFT747]